MVSQEYGIAFYETLEILKHTKKEDVDKIPNKFLEFLKNNASQNYDLTLDFDKSLAEMNLSTKTIGILSIIIKKYWCNDEKRKQFEIRLQENEMKYQDELREKYNSNSLFKKKEIVDVKNRNEENMQMIEYKEQK